MLIEEGSAEASRRKELLTKNVDDLQRCNHLHQDGPAITGVVIPLEFESLLLLRHWDKAMGVIQRAAKQDCALKTLERLARLAVRSHCPTALQSEAVKTALEAMISNTTELDVQKFAAWFRVLLETSLVSNKEQARGFFGQVRDMIPSLSYPVSELHWLVSTAWNVSVELWSAGAMAEACTWAEVALGLLPFASDTAAAIGMGEKQIREAYSKMLAERDEEIAMEIT
ncbi:hypothetical protein M427DRAFT_255110 [Gonapodya prolifera JEL478]|uniref:Uncharacterized protein n=1 Tax=Gonapodya prolifera (strain JEL478) TaxID=1344416 RepID=A0A139ALE4_GONPJ|nr:hypothetical protein M427DRAFT_255110 [Gonapodya prolifera JEL478]|eukprot:KXS17606.1 hypothetical protein M427DRAFT_255110 [Gonapodya prolifera JEL478]